MRIIDHNEFMQMPPGTIFMKFEPCYFSDLSVKESCYGSSFGVTSLSGEIDTEDEFINSIDTNNKLIEMADDGSSVDLDFYCSYRDSISNGDKYAVFEKNDVLGLIEKLNKCLKEGYKELS